MAEVILNSSNFEAEVLKSDIPVLVDFWAAWCGPCQMLGPIVASVAEEVEGKVKVCKLNIDEEMELSDVYKVVSIPTLLVFKNGEVVNKSVGLCSKEDILKLIEV